LKYHSLCVFCGSSHHADEKYKTLASEMGTTLGERGHRVIYGGGHVGLMGAMADAALKAGAEVIGIIPEHIRVREIQHSGLTRLHVVDTMQTRKRMMARESDAFIILPGGFGTLDETFEVLTDKQLGLHNKPIVILNKDGFWDPMIALIDHLIDTGFAPRENYLMYKVVSTIEDVFPALEAPEHAPFDPMEKWK
jgi:uncharacterized protein (TIGR00730 family)